MYNKFTCNYDSRVVIYEHKMFIRLATGREIGYKLVVYGSNTFFNKIKVLGSPRLREPWRRIRL